ncbi:MAG TPA: hypothetical protein VEK08_17520 [Planctomycetota bacterium]|nr:hypothetical protein [Planctomycetota bacterium]
MREIKTDSYGPAAKELIALAQSEGRPSTLTFSTPAAGARAALAGMNDQNVSANRRVRMPHDAESLRAALWLLFDYEKESHELSQNIPTPSGSYWHGILHRREPDASNAKYWMARIGEHPVLPELLQDAREIASLAGPAGKTLLGALDKMSIFDAAWFVDRCTTPADPQSTKVLLDIQRREWALLFDYNFKKAFA